MLCTLRICTRRTFHLHGRSDGTARALERNGLLSETTQGTAGGLLVRCRARDSDKDCCDRDLHLRFAGVLLYNNIQDCCDSAIKCIGTVEGNNICCFCEMKTRRSPPSRSNILSQSTPSSLRTNPFFVRWTAGEKKERCNSRDLAGLAYVSQSRDNIFWGCFSSINSALCRRGGEQSANPSPLF